MFTYTESKFKTLKRHMKKRAFQRFGLNLTDQEIKDMGLMCKSGNYICHLGYESLIKSRMVLKFKNQIIPVIYDKSRHCIITCLSIDMLSNEEQDQISINLPIYEEKRRLKKLQKLKGDKNEYSI